MNFQIPRALGVIDQLFVGKTGRLWGQEGSSAGKWLPMEA